LIKYQLYTLAAFLCLIAFSCERSSDSGGSQNAVEKLFEKGENVANDIKVREASIDSAYALFANNKNDSVTRFFYRRATVAYYDLYKYEKSLRASHKVYRMGAEAGDSLTMAKAAYFSGICYSGKNNNDSAFYFYRQAEKLYMNLNDTSLLGEIGLYKAYIYFNIGEYVQCESEAIKALRLLEKKKSTIDIYKANNLIGSALFGQNNYQGAIKYYREALAQLDNLKKEGYPEDVISNYKAYCYNNMGQVYIKQEDHPDAIRIYEQALSGPDSKVIEPSLRAMLLNNLAYAKLKSGDDRDLPAMFYRSLHIRDSIDDRSGIVASNIYLGEYFASHKDTARAVMYLKHGYEGARRINSNDEIMNSSKLLSDIDQKDGAFYAEQYISVNEKMQEAAKANREKFARIEYETDKLQDEKEALDRKNSYIMGISVIVLLFVAAIFIIYYLNSRNKELLLIQEQQKASEEIYQLMFEQQANIETARTEEKTRIAMELHDGILNNIYAVRLNLDFINKKSDEESVLKRKGFIKELQNVEGEIRAVSHDLSRNEIFNQGQDFGTILRFMITSQKNNFNTDFGASIDPSIDWDAMNNTYKVNIYRIVQEALQNINKYSEAKNAGVAIIQQDNNLNIAVTDDGVGFDPEKAKGGIGLRNLRKRTDALKGVLSISSQKGKGSSIEVVFPLA
jgi:signal transduction histidine kinase/tetratricopeptide (TPR) repeat protein